MPGQVILEPISSRIPAEEKNSFIKACEAIGTTPSNAIRMFVRAFNEYQGFPFDTSRPYKLSAEAEASLREVENEITNGTAHRFGSVAELRAELNL